MSVINAHKLSFGFGNKTVLSNLSFSLDEGRVLGLLGPNGAGKSTLINLINGFLEADKGILSIYNEPAGKLSHGTKERIAYLMEGHVQYGFMNIAQLETYYSTIYHNWNTEIYHQTIGESQISPHQKIQTMSRGEQSRVALAACLAQNADLLILDDFSMGLDPIYRKSFINELIAYKNEHRKSMLITSHIVQDMEGLIDDVMILAYDYYLAPQSMEEFMETNKNSGKSLEEIFINLINKQ